MMMSVFLCIFYLYLYILYHQHINCNFLSFNDSSRYLYQISLYQKYQTFSISCNVNKVYQLFIYFLYFLLHNNLANEI